MSERIPTYDEKAAAQAAAQEAHLTAPAPCEAERRTKQALYALENDWAAGLVDYAKLRDLLTARDGEPCQDHTGPAL